MQNKKQLFIKFALKYQTQINAIFVLIIAVYFYVSISWNVVFDILLNIPSSIMQFFNTVFYFITSFLQKFYLDITTYPTNLKIISVGILKRFLFEDIIIPLFAKYYFKIIKDDYILYYKLKYREFKKFPLFLRTSLSSPIFASLVAIVSYFKVIGLLFFSIQKLFTNTIFSKLKFLFIKWIPAIYIILIDMPIISIIVDYLALAKIISWIQNIKIFGISYIINLFSKFAKLLDKRIQTIQNFFYGNIGLYLRNNAIMKKYKLREKIDKILKDNIDDYHVLSKGYNNIAFRKKIQRLVKWRLIRKEKKRLNRYKWIRILKEKLT